MSEPVTLDAIYSLLERVAVKVGVLDLPEPPAPPEPVPEPPAPAHGILFPAGNIQTKGLNGQPYNLPWSRIARWEPAITDAVAALGTPYHPLLLAAFIVIESQGKHYTHDGLTGMADEVIRGRGDARSRGLLQIRCDLHSANDMDRCLNPQRHIALGAKLLADWMKSEGSWEAALTNKWHPGTDPASGIGPPAYIRIVRDLIHEVKAVWPEASEPGAPEEPTAPEPGPAGIVFGRVPKPIWQDRQIPDANNRAWDNLGQRQVRGVVYHRQVGSNWGTDGWFRMLWQPNGQPGGGQLGLTDFGIDHSSGEILQWNDYLGRGRAGISPNRAGWASGPWENPPGDGRAYVAKYGVSAINRDLVSLEIAGQYGDPISAAGIEAIVGMSAYLADQAKVPWTDYPLNPHTGLVFTYAHSEFQGHKPCPGAVVLGLIPDIIARTKAVLKRHQAA